MESGRVNPLHHLGPSDLRLDREERIMREEDPCRSHSDFATGCSGSSAGRVRCCCPIPRASWHHNSRVCSSITGPTTHHRVADSRSVERKPAMTAWLRPPRLAAMDRAVAGRRSGMAAGSRWPLPEPSVAGGLSSRRRVVQACRSGVQTTIVAVNGGWLQWRPSLDSPLPIGLAQASWLQSPCQSPSPSLSSCGGQARLTITGAWSLGWGSPRWLRSITQPLAHSSSSGER
jgi:hypothetical protein